MHQLLCGVNDTVIIDGYRVQVLEVTSEVVRLGLSTPGGDRVVHEISLTHGAPANRPTLSGPSYTRPAIN